MGLASCFQGFGTSELFPWDTQTVPMGYSVVNPCGDHMTDVACSLNPRLMTVDQTDTKSKEINFNNAASDDERQRSIGKRVLK